MCADELQQPQKQMIETRWAKVFDDLAFRFKELEADRDDLAKNLVTMRMQWAKTKRQRDAIRRTFCLMIASGNFNARDGDTAFLDRAKDVAKVNGWNCFAEDDK
jgi:hypothetical protein